jgi:hypothetical protein
MKNINKAVLTAAIAARHSKLPSVGMVVTPPTNFTEAYFTMNGLIHDLKTYYCCDVQFRTQKALDLIRRECTKLSSTHCIIGRDAFKTIMADYGYVVVYEEHNHRGVLVSAGDHLYFSLL